MSRYQVTRGPNGIVYQSGLDVRPRGQPKPGMVTRGPYRAVVIHTYVTDSADVSERGWQVEADVVLVRSGVRINHVPVAQPVYGVNDAQPWVPRKTTRALTDGRVLNIDAVLSKRGLFQGTITPLDDVDGDTVLVDFIEGDPQFPIVRGLLPHRRSKRDVIEGTGWSEAGAGSERGSPHADEHYSRFAGTEQRINADGDLLIDTVGATSDRVNESPAVGGGQIRLRVKSDKRFTVEMNGIDVLEVWRDATGVHVDLGEGATERVILGDSFMELFNAHTHPDPVGGTTGVPVVPMTDALLSDVSKTKKV